jgi:signal transduction histidine kinase
MTTTTATPQTAATERQPVVGNILIVEDSSMVRLKLAHSLREQGHTVTAAENGLQALARLETDQFDCMLLDLMMPEMSGHEVLRRMRNDSRWCHLPVIVVSALEDLDSMVQCIEMGAEDYLFKPFNPVLLTARVQATLQKKKLRDLEQSYVAQEMMLRQSEKLATLGKLSAGMAHELNNPAGAMLSSSEQLGALIEELQPVYLRLLALASSEQQRALLIELDHLARTRTRNPLRFSSAECSDRELELEAYLERYDCPNVWEYTPALVSLGYDPPQLEALATQLPGDLFVLLLPWLSNIFTVYSLLAEIKTGATRIAGIVDALKGYTYLDQAPIQAVNINQALDTTLTMLQNRLEPGIQVERAYDEQLPSIQAYAGEINQVWTHIIDNALQAMNGQGTLVVRTRCDGKHLVVVIEDSGPGIPADIQSRIFDPFFTTRPPGHGTGLGLNICHNIVVQKHNGQIRVDSRPGRTCFEVRLPLDCNLPG